MSINRDGSSLPEAETPSSTSTTSSGCTAPTLPANLGGEGGIVRHPTLDLAFAPTNDRSVLVLETSGHYRVRAELPLVESLVGPLTMTLPRAGDPADLVVRLHGVTPSGNVVTLPVWQQAIQ